jgi:hypothetical protein
MTYDASFGHRALLITDHGAEAQAHLGYYERQRADAVALAHRLGSQGAAYPDWVNCFGQYLGTDLVRRILEVRPNVAAYIALDCYWQWRYFPQDATHRHRLQAMREIADFALACFVDEQGDEAMLKPCMAGNESDVMVRNDTFNALVIARALAAFAEMAHDLDVAISPRYADLARKLYAGLSKNCRDGVWMAYRAAKYATMQFDYYLANLPDGIDTRAIDWYLQATRTPWGMDYPQPSEAYRDWPWLSARAAIVLARLGRSAESFQNLVNTGRYVSSLGAIPEKIRLDGYVIGYWYTTAHSLFIWSMAEALCHPGRDDEVRLLWGLDGAWKDVAFRDLRLPGGLLASADIQGGRLHHLSVTNRSPASLERILSLNPLYGQLQTAQVSLPGGKTVVVV